MLQTSYNEDASSRFFASYLGRICASCMLVSGGSMRRDAGMNANLWVQYALSHPANTTAKWSIDICELLPLIETSKNFSPASMFFKTSHSRIFFDVLEHSHTFAQRTSERGQGVDRHVQFMNSMNEQSA